MGAVELNGFEEAPPAHIPLLVRAFISKHPAVIVNFMLEYGVLNNLGYRLVKNDNSDL